LVVGEFLNGLTTRFLHIADSNELHIRLLQKTTQVIGAAIADSDATDDDSFAGSNRSTSPKC
jgi:hypothetical protein